MKWISLCGIIVSVSTGVSKNEIGNIIVIYPNPIIKDLNIEMMNIKEIISDKKYIIRIIDLTAREVFRKEFYNKFKIDASNFSKGLFFVWVFGEEGLGCYTEKILIE